MLVSDIEICNYADDTTLYMSHINATNKISKLYSGISTIAGWFKNSSMKSNSDKCHVMIFGDQSE